MSTSILLEDVCFECNKNNGVQSSTHCKFCNEPLYKNTWIIDMVINTQLILSGTTELNHFKKFIMDDEYYIRGEKKTYSYKFIYNKFNIDFENEKLVFKINELDKPLIIKFGSILKYELSYSESGLISVMTIILKNDLVIGIGYNNYNEKIHKIFNIILN